MKKKSMVIFGVLAALLAFSVVLASCDDPNKDNGEPGLPPDLQGTWTGGDYTLVITETTAKLSGTGGNGTGDEITHNLTSTDDSYTGYTQYHFGEGNSIVWMPATKKMTIITGFGLPNGIAGSSLSKQ